MARFSYRIERESSNFLIQYGDVADGSNSIVVPYHGEVFVDEETHMVLRLMQQAEIPPAFSDQRQRVCRRLRVRRGGR